MIDRYFRDHPRTVGETYFQHLCTATSFAVTMIGAGLACLVHALVPGLFVRTGSQVIEHLHNRMIVHRPRSKMHPDMIDQPIISE